MHESYFAFIMVHSYLVERLSDLFRCDSISPAKGSDVHVSDTFCSTNSLGVIMSATRRSRYSYMCVTVACFEMFDQNAL